ncbi:MAG: hypothetical protein UR65_C0049G0002 [Candidatus Moranbacteria bacterium GW2011_GWE2_35_164]|nr:MAG: hypothetical protein UR65_C0049G0002 [Candidatus Moranbacteria bacterium GW2011_GWE2_35_164]
MGVEQIKLESGMVLCAKAIFEKTFSEMVFY